MSVEGPIPAPVASPPTTAAAGPAVPAETRRACPSCGAKLKPHSQRCHLCYAWLGWGPPPRRIAKYQLISTDFMAAERENRRNTAILIALVLTIGLFVGWLLGWLIEAIASDTVPPFDSPSGILGGLLFLGFGAIAVLVMLLVGRGTLLSLTGAVRVTAEQEPVFYNVTEEMAIAAGLPVPELAVIESPALNAFAAGMRTDRAAIAVTRGLLQTLTRDELQGVVAHEMAHIRNLDTRYLTAVAMLVGLIVLVADFGARILPRMRFGQSRRSGSKGANPLVAVVLVVGFLCLILAPVFARLVQLAVSRQREFLADATSVRLTRNPLGLISALEKLHDSSVPLANANRAVQHMFIVNPMRDFEETDSALTATHPPIARRIERLRNLSSALATDGTQSPPTSPPEGA